MDPQFRCVRCSRRFDRLMGDPARPDHLAPAYDSGDHLHPNDAGFKAMAAAIDLRVFRDGRVNQQEEKQVLSRRALTGCFLGALFSLASRRAHTAESIRHPSLFDSTLLRNLDSQPHHHGADDAGSGGSTEDRESIDG